MSAGLTLGAVGVRSTDFYPRTVPFGGVDLSSGNASMQAAMKAGGAGAGVQQFGALPTMWWLGIIIVLVALRLAHEFS